MGLVIKHFRFENEISFKDEISSHFTANNQNYFNLSNFPRYVFLDLTYVTQKVRSHRRNSVKRIAICHTTENSSLKPKIVAQQKDKMSC